LKYIGRDAAHQLAGNDRFVEDSNTGHVSLEACSNRDGEVSREVLRMAAGEIDDDILDHARTPHARSITRSALDGFKWLGGRGIAVPWPPLGLLLFAVLVELA